MKLISFAVATFLLVGCSHSTSEAQNSNFSVKEETEEVVDYSKLIQLTTIETGWDVVNDISFGQVNVRISVKNISGKPIKDIIDVKYRLTEDDKVIEEHSKTLQYRKSIPWNAGLVKSSVIDGNFLHDVMQHNIHAELYDDNNNLLWEGDIEKRVLEKK